MVTKNKTAAAKSPSAKKEKKRTSAKKASPPAKKSAGTNPTRGLKSSRPLRAQADVLREEKRELPDLVNETKLFLFPVDPYRVFSYWIIRHADLVRMTDRLKAKYKQLTPVLRFYDVTGTAADETRALHSFDIPVDLQSGKFYVRLWHSGRQYIAALGFWNEFGIFFPLTRSNLIEVPLDPQSKHTADPAGSSLSMFIDRCFLPGVSSYPTVSDK
jgi:hypothetical protein